MQVANIGEGIEQARRECMDRERWRIFCRGHPWVTFPEGMKHQTID